MIEPTAYDVSAKLQALQKRFSDKAVGEFNALDEIASQIHSGKAGGDQLEQAYRILHRLAGSAGTFGFSKLGNEARDLELQIKPLLDDLSGASSALTPLSKIFYQRLTGLPALLKPGDPQVYELSSGAPDITADEPLILVFEPDQKRGCELAESLALYGYQSQWLSSVADWRSKAGAMPSVIVIRDQTFLTEGAEFSQSFTDLPVICISATDSFAHRYALAQKGAEAFFCEPLDLPVMAEHIERLLTDHADAANGRVLIVDDDQELAEHYQLVLSSGGMDVRTVGGDPSLLLPILAEFRPDIVLMDIQMGDISGPTLARMLRFETEWLSLPIIYLSAESDREMQLEAMAKGGDDFLTKPVSDSFLLRTLRVRCYRARQLDKLVSRDSLTGLLKHSLVKAEVAKEHARCQRMKHSSVVAMLDLDHFKKVNDTQGHRAGDLVIKGLANLLRHRLRKTDIVGRYGGEEFVVALPDCSMERAKSVLKSVCEDFSRIMFHGAGGEFSVTLSVGLAALSDYPHPEDAIEAADQALYDRKRAGRNGVTAALL
jgi:diguanylate cyclase (GGDEF)-like protein